MNSTSSPATPNPVVTTITVVKNDAAGLARTLESVAEQSYPHLQHVVVDGGSTDQTAQVIRSHAARLDRWVSEPDSGISDAFNKGIRLARGTWFNFLNAGDTYLDPDSVARVVQHFPGELIVTGFARFGQSTIPAALPREGDPLWRRAAISHQASFIHRRVFDEMGPYDLAFELRMDYEFWLRALGRFPARFLPDTIVDFAAQGVSSRRRIRFYFEEIRANFRHLPTPWRATLSVGRAALAEWVHKYTPLGGLRRTFRRQQRTR